MTHQAYTYGGVNVPSNFDPTSNATTGRFNPAFGNWYTAYMFNPFVKFKGFEYFGTIEYAQGGDKAGTDVQRDVRQYVNDIVFRFGNTEQFYIGARYGTVNGKLSNADAKAVTVNRFESSLGWFMTKNILAKVAYTNQTYHDYTQTSGGNTSLNDLYGGSFEGLMFEAVIAF
jgi:hypothetical protein